MIDGPRFLDMASLSPAYPAYPKNKKNLDQLIEIQKSLNINHKVFMILKLAHDF